MGQPLKIEDAETVFFITTRTIASRLWFVNNRRLEAAILSFLARYVERYGAMVYAFIIMGNHYHLVAKFPRCNKKAFFRIFNSMIAKLTQQHVESFEGKLWARRYADHVLPNNEDVEHYFFYSALNPVGSGLTKTLGSYRSYNSFLDAARGKARTFKVFERSAYTEALRRGHAVHREDFIKEHTLKYERLPGYENLSPEQYRNMLLGKLEVKRVATINKRLSEGKGFGEEKTLRKTRAGEKPHFTKTSTRNSFRPLVLTLCSETKKRFLDWYFAIRDKFIIASKAFRAGDLTAEFPPGTYRPINYCR